jgi:hypothetical protein
VLGLQFEAIIKLAGGPGDRWSGHRKMAGREESLDTVLSHQGKLLVGFAPTRGSLHPFNADERQRATRLVTPGERFGWRMLMRALAGSFTESATENVPPAIRSTVASRR